jgi:hypothetical protein
VPRKLRESIVEKTRKIDLHDKPIPEEFIGMNQHYLALADKVLGPMEEKPPRDRRKKKREVE